jgi:carboxyl-terminal processing protease
MKDATTHTGNSRKRIFRILKWVIGSIVAMSIIVVVAAGATAIVDRRVAFEKITPKERHLAIYDAFCTQIKRHYFDSSFSGVDWNEIDQKWREKAAAATTDSELYANVLSNIGLQFPASHIAVQVPSRLPAKSANEDEAVAARTRGVVSLLVDGPGFDYVTIRRGSSTGSIVGDIVRGSAADRAGIEPGWLAGDFAFTNNANSTTVHFAGAFVKLTPDQELQYERALQISYEGIGTERLIEPVTANTIKLEYDLVPLPAQGDFATKRLPGGSTYIRFDTFGNSDIQFPTFFDSKVVNQVLAALDHAGPEGVIIDLRKNHGGLQHELRRLLDRVLKNDSRVGTLRSREGVEYWRTASHARTYSGPLVVLIGPFTASAAEIFAAAIQDSARGRLVGRMTNGAVLEGQRFPLPDGGRVQIPVKDFVRADGRRIEGVGVEPDIRVIPSLEEIRSGRDVVIERAVLELRNSAGGGQRS